MSNPFDRYNEYIDTLQFRIKARDLQIEAFKSGSKYVALQNEMIAADRKAQSEIRELKHEVGQIRRDYETSSKPSSLSMNHRKIANSREKTNRKRGAQPGHEWHGRKRLEPTGTVLLEAPKEMLEDPRYTATGDTVSKQVISIGLAVTVTEYRTPAFRERATGKIKHGPFPDGISLCIDVHAALHVQKTKGRK